MGYDVRGWPVRPRDTGVDGIPLLSDRDGVAAAAVADLVVVSTDTARHVDDARRVLDAGARRVLVEKPVAPTAADAERLPGAPLGPRAGDGRGPAASTSRLPALPNGGGRPGRAALRRGVLAVLAAVMAPRPRLPRLLLRSPRRGRGAARPRPRDRLRHSRVRSAATRLGRARRRRAARHGRGAGRHRAVGDGHGLGDRAGRLRHPTAAARRPRHLAERQRRLGPDDGDGHGGRRPTAAAPRRRRRRTSTGTRSWPARPAQH